MVYSKQELSSLKNDQLKTILTEMHQSTTGTKDILVTRILENMVELPADHIKLTRGGDHGGREQAEDDGGMEQDQAEDPKKVAMDQLAKDLRLSQRTTDLLQQAGYVQVDDMQLLTPEIVDALDTTSRDRQSILKFLQPKASNASSILFVNSKEKSRRKPFFAPPMFNIPNAPVLHRHHSSSTSSGETIDERTVMRVQSCFELPKFARDLPRPHLFISPKPNERGVLKDCTALSISISEFIAECARLSQRLSL